MTVKNIYPLAIHFPEKKLEKLHNMLGNYVNTIYELREKI